MSVTLHHGDCLDVMRQMIADGVKVDSIVTDPPYHLTSIVKRFGGKNAAAAQHGTDGLYARASAGFMGKQWDGGDIAFRPETWALAFELLNPGGHMFAFSGTRTYHRMACAIEDAGFVIRDQFAWVYGSGFPKSHDFGEQFDKSLYGKFVDIDGGEEIPQSHFGAYWEGWGTAVKPAWEPICLAQKPVEGTIAGNVLKHGVGGLNIDGCRVEAGEAWNSVGELSGGNTVTCLGDGLNNSGRSAGHPSGRFPANLTHDGSPEVLACFPDSDGQLADISETAPSAKTSRVYGAMKRRGEASQDRRYTAEGSTDFAALPGARRGDSGSAARFFYSSKADAGDRWGSKHPTVKPVDLIRYYARLITPPGGLILDPFAGSGTLGVAAMAEGFNAVLIEREAEYVADIRERIAFYEGGDRHSLASKNRNRVADAGPLFGGSEQAPGGGGGRSTDTSPIRTNDWAGRAEMVGAK